MLDDSNLIISAPYASTISSEGNLVTSNGAATSTEVIGLVYPLSVNNTHFFFAGTETNPPVFFKNRPSGNNFKVEILNFDNAISTGNYEWTLILHFKKL